MSGNAFKTVLIMSAVGSVLCLVLQCAAPLMRRRCDLRRCYCAWLVPLAVMLIPISFTLPQNAVSLVETTGRVIHTAKISEQVTASAGRGFEPGAVWAIGAAAMLVRLIAEYARLRRTVCKSSVRDDSLEGIPKRIIVRRTELPVSPMLIGFVRPVLILPSGMSDSETLRLVILHELTHYRRHDIYLKAAAELAVCIHWFNPAAYLIRKRIDEECELACDCSVSMKLSESERGKYLNVILDLIESNSRRICAAMQMSGNRRLLERRILTVRKAKPARFAEKIVSMALSMLLLFIGVYASGTLNGRTADMPAAAPPDKAENVKDEVRSETAVLNMPSTKEEITAEDSAAQADFASEAPLEKEADKEETEQALEESPEDVHEAVKRVNGITGEYSSANGGRSRAEGIVCDDNGNLAVSFSLSMQTAIRIRIFETEAHALCGEYSIPAGDGSIYVFGGLDTARKYDVEICGETGSDWAVEGSYTIY